MRYIRQKQPTQGASAHFHGRYDFARPALRLVIRGGHADAGQADRQGIGILRRPDAERLQPLQDHHHLFPGHGDPWDTHRVRNFPRVAHKRRADRFEHPSRRAFEYHSSSLATVRTTAQTIRDGKEVGLLC